MIEMPSGRVPCRWGSSSTNRVDMLKVELAELMIQPLFFRHGHGRIHTRVSFPDSPG
jgi:hypothetical protein